MALTRAYEEHEVGPELRRVYADVRASFDLPFVPTVFKLLAANPEYLKTMWSDLGQVARSKEFHAAARALEEFAHSLAVRGGWRFQDPRKVLAAQKFSLDDIEALAAVPYIFARAEAQVAIFTRLMQRGYAGGQRGRVNELRQAAALSRMLSLHVPNEKEASLRVWLIYADIKKTTGARNVFSMFRVLSPFPGYLAATWLDSKKMLAEPTFRSAREETARRVTSLLAGLPVKDHRARKSIAPQEWREIEDTVDGYARQMPGFALLNSVWKRSFPQGSGELLSVRAS